MCNVLSQHKAKNSSNVSLLSFTLRELWEKRYYLIELYYLIEKFLPHHSCIFLILCIPEMRFNVESLRRQRA